MEIVKSAVFLYDIVTLPVYYAVQRPWIKRRKAKETKARLDVVNNAQSYVWKSVAKSERNIVDECKTIDAYFRAIVKQHGSNKCLGFRKVVHEEHETQRDGKCFKKMILAPNYKWFTYSQIDKRIDDVSKGFLLNGIKAKEKVVIFAETRLEWMLTFQALMRIGATVGTLYATLGEDGIIYGVNQLDSSCIVTTSDLLPKLKKILPKISTIKLVICIEDTKNDDVEDGTNEETKIITFRELETIGSQASPKLEAEPPTENDIAVIMYTSGSTGTPKGVLLTHKNLIAAQRGLRTLANSWPNGWSNKTYIGYLPLAHVLELMAELFFISIGVAVGYSSPLTLSDKSPGIKEGSLGDVSVLRPTVMGGVPIVLEKIRKGVFEQLKAKGRFVEDLFEFAILYKNYWLEKGYNTPILDFLLFRKIRAGLGSKLEFMFCGGAPLSPETQAFIRACLGVTMILGYGTTETSGAGTICSLFDINLGRVGPPVSITRIKLIAWEEGNYKPTDKPNPRGEIVVGGDCVAVGYYMNDDETNACFFDENGTRWFQTGDIGEMFPDGTLKIIDRRKDLIKLQNGEYVSLGKIETELKRCEYVDNICVYGDSLQTFVVALIVPNKPKLQSLSQQNDKNQNTVTNLIEDERVVDAVFNAIKEIAKQSGLNKYETPQKIKLCEEEWTPDNGLLTAAMKIRRKQIQDYYQADIEKLYSLDNNYNENKVNVESIPCYNPNVN